MQSDPAQISASHSDVPSSDGNEIWITSGYTLRKIVGVLGISLPVILYFFVFVDTGHGSPLESLSHYYFTRAGTVFSATLSILGLFLIVYKGKEKVDFVVSLVAGLFVFCIVLFPTGNLANACCDVEKTYAVTFLKTSSLRVTFHYISAGIFLLSLAYMSLFLFTKSNHKPSKRTPHKHLRNKIYHVCGVIMIAAILVILAGHGNIIPDEIYTSNHLTFWMESLAVEAFGFSWLVKGEGLFKDETPEERTEAKD